MYLANKQISLTEAAEPYEGIEMVKVTLEDGSVETMPKKLFEVSETDAASDLTLMRQSRIQAVAREVLALLLAWGIRVDEVQHLTSILVQSINQSIQAAESKLWGKDSLDLNLLDVDKVIREKLTLKDIINMEDAENKPVSPGQTTTPETPETPPATDTPETPEPKPEE